MKKKQKIFAGLILALILVCVGVFVTKEKAPAPVSTEIVANQISDINVDSSSTDVSAGLTKTETKTTVSKTEVPIATSSQNKVVSEKTQSITIVAGDFSGSISLPQQSSLYDALTLAKNNGQIIFSGKTYPELGFFVTDIGSLHGGGGKNLIYYVNGKEADVGVSSYMPQNGDIITWKLE